MRKLCLDAVGGLNVRDGFEMQASNFTSKEKQHGSHVKFRRGHNHGVAVLVRKNRLGARSGNVRKPNNSNEGAIATTIARVAQLPNIPKLATAFSAMPPCCQLQFPGCGLVYKYVQTYKP